MSLPGVVRVLLVDDDEDDWVLTRDLLEEVEGVRFELEWASDYEGGRGAIARRAHDVYLIDYRLGARDGLDLLREGLAAGSTAPFILLTGQGDRAVDLEAMRLGAADYLVKRQITAPLLERAVRHALERAQTLEALVESERFLHSTLDALSTRIAILDRDGVVLAVNAAWRALPGGPFFGPGHAPGSNYLDACDAAPRGPDEDGSRLARAIREVLRLDGGERALELRWGAGGGNGARADARRWSLVRVTRFAGGGAARAVVAHEDVTGLKQAEQALLASEEQLRHVQKMEAVGRLAGGVAHDFNNVLAVITAYAELAREHAAEGSRLAGFVDEIGRAAGRAADLTRQLLLFSRRQMSEPRRFDLNRAVEEMERMLRRLIGEHIELVVDLAPGAAQVRADPGQIEQVLMNLAVNARDAMPRGGRLTLTTSRLELDEGLARLEGAEVRPGRFVALEVADTGVGMDAATRERAFEPFFTTKPLGHGTGLGLATVYGIVKQSGGSIRVRSEAGRGSCFRVLLPWVAEDEEEAGDAPAAEPPGGGSETILLVEDDAVLRPVLGAILRERGYRVLEAADGRDGLELSERHEGGIELMVTDLVMPNMGGAELWERLSERRPRTAVLFISGYTDPAVVPPGLADPARPFLGKPFTPAALVRKVRETLDARAAS